jgi:hypothetical protein
VAFAPIPLNGCAFFHKTLFAQPAFCVPT